MIGKCNTGGGKPEEEKTVTAGTSVIEVSPSSGKVMKKVTVNPTPSQSKTVTPLTSQQTVSPDSGKLLSSVVVNGDSDLVAGNIKQGVNIFGVDGLFDNSNGQYVWRKYQYSTERGDFVDFVVSNSKTTYPDGAVHTDGYWYKLYGQPLEIVTWAGGTDEQIVAMVAAADEGIIDLADYWAVGDIRKVQLSAMSATGVSESHAAQQVELVLMHAGGYELSEAVPSGRTTCSFVVGQKNCLNTEGYMNPSDTNNGSWNGCARRTWCNNVYRKAMPASLLPIFKQFKTTTAQVYNGSINQISIDYFALPAEREILDNRILSTETEWKALFQFEWYKTITNRIKLRNSNANAWYQRSPGNDGSIYFDMINIDGRGNYNSKASSARGIAPFGCI